MIDLLDASERAHGLWLPKGFDRIEGFRHLRTFPVGNELSVMKLRPLLDEVRLTSVRHVRRLAFERRIPFLKIGSRVRFEPSVEEEWLSTLRIDASASTKGLADSGQPRSRSVSGARDRAGNALGRLPSRQGRDGPAWRAD